MRRLLENGANTSFINRIMDEDVSLERLIEDPVVSLRALSTIANPRIVLPGALYGAARRNSAGLLISATPSRCNPCWPHSASLKGAFWKATPIVSGARVLRLVQAHRQSRQSCRHRRGGRRGERLRRRPRYSGRGSSRSQTGIAGEWISARSILDRAADAMEAERERFVSSARARGG